LLVKTKAALLKKDCKCINQFYNYKTYFSFFL
jgi:hypothetical protein